MKEPPHVFVAGYQAKAALHHDGEVWFIPKGAAASTHILKPASKKLSDIDLVEHAIVLAAKDAGLNVSSAGLVHFGSERAFVTKRYDREIEEGGRVRRLHQEDLLQSLGRDRKSKYQRQQGPSLPEILKHIAAKSSQPEKDVEEFIRLTAFNVAVGNADGHAKNSSFLLAPGSVKLAPAYDLQSSTPYPNYSQILAFSIGSQHDYRFVNAGNWANVAKRAGLDEDEVLSWVSETSQRAVESAANRLAGLPSIVADPILSLLDTVQARLPAPNTTAPATPHKTANDNPTST